MKPINEIITANRSLIDFEKEDIERRKTPNVSAGGLAAAFSSAKSGDSDFGTLFIGASGGNADRLILSDVYGKDFMIGDARIKPEGNNIIHYANGPLEFYMLKLFYSNNLNERFYDKFCNGVLWPLDHIVNDELYDTMTSLATFNFDLNDHTNYHSGNIIVSDAVGSVIKNNSRVWKTGRGNLGKDLSVLVNDYHHALVPMFLRQEFIELDISPRAKVHVGIFFHTPYFNVHSLRDLRLKGKTDMMGRRVTLEDIAAEYSFGPLGSNLVGFQTPRDAKNFVTALDYYHSRRGVRVIPKNGHYEVHHRMPHRVTIVGAFPIGVNVDMILNQVTLDKKLEFKARYVGSEEQVDIAKMIEGDKENGITDLGFIGRLDYTKGIPWMLNQFEGLLERSENLNNRQRYRLIMVTQSSRQGNNDYIRLKNGVERTVKKINSTHEGKLGYVPIIYVNTGINPPNNYRFLRDVKGILVPSEEDGMNLVGIEGALAKYHLPKNERGFIAYRRGGIAHYTRGHGQNHGVGHFDGKTDLECLESLENLNTQNLSNGFLKYLHQNFRVDAWMTALQHSIVNRTYEPHMRIS